MDAKKCDRCGNLYDPTSKDFKQELENKKISQTYTFDESYLVIRICTLSKDRRADLCIDCRLDFKDFWNGEIKY